MIQSLIKQNYYNYLCGQQLICVKDILFLCDAIWILFTSTVSCVGDVYALTYNDFSTVTPDAPPFLSSSIKL